MKAPPIPFVSRLALAAGAAALGGCLIVPTNYTASGSRHNVSSRTSEQLRPGVTTKEEVLLTLGEPDFSSEDGQRVGYGWTKVKALMVVAGYGGAAGAEILRSYVLEVSFDADSRVSQVRLMKEWGPAVLPSRELEPAPN